jgi:HEAT repeat protein
MLRYRSVRKHFDALSSGDETERTMAANALSGLRGRRVRRKLRRFLGDPDPEVRKLSAYGLGFAGESSDAPALVAKLQHKTEPTEVRTHCAEALGHIGPGPDDARDALIDALADDDPEVRFWAAFALGSYGDETAIPALEALAREPDYVVPRWWSVRKEATDAISRIRTFPREDHRG